MQKIDQLNVAAIVVAVVGSAFAVAVYEPGAGAVDFAITWPEDQFAIAGANDAHTGAGEIHVPLVIPYVNVSRVSVEVEVVVAGPRLEAQSFQVDVMGPDVGPSSATGSVPVGADEARVTVTVNVDVADLPTNETISAMDEADALDQLNRTLASKRGQGTWDVAVTFTETQRQAVAPETHEVNALATVHVWRAEVSQDLPDVEGVA